ncbi:HET-domain-containing protein [Xylariaceae sp. FL0594]|nr:HET-domain-containing protein [Xylariaceae sp. FL0594]
MWLIDTTLLELRFHGSALPGSYAILSHTWAENHEVSFQEFLDVTRRTRKKGYEKIAAACELARLRGLKWCWVDTCCIDKTSSSNLSEAINSMFRWYRESAVCFAHLEQLQPDPLRERAARLQGDFAACAWFRRGWTLQELIAPSKVEFYDRGWSIRGTKAELIDTLHAITGVSTRVLTNSYLLGEIPVATRMSWAAGRQTKKVEDMAYCLLGIFDLYMPLIYGEGERAFTRLQEEIIKDKHDLSIFAWRAEPNGQKYRGLLARSPSEFRPCEAAQPSYHLKMTTDYSTTNRGIRLNTLLGTDKDGSFILPLGCATTNDPPSNALDTKVNKRQLLEDRNSVGVYLKTAPAYGLVRVNPGKFHVYEGWTSSILSQHKRTRFHAPKDLKQRDCSQIDDQRRLSIRIGSKTDEGGLFCCEVENAGPDYAWDSSSQTFITMGDRRFTGFCRLRVTTTTAATSSRRASSSFQCILVCGLMRIPSTDPNSVPLNHEDNGGAHVRAWCGVFSHASPLWSELCDLTSSSPGRHDHHNTDGSSTSVVNLLHLRNLVDKKFGKGDLDRCVSETASEIVLVFAKARKERERDGDDAWRFGIDVSADCILRQSSNVRAPSTLVKDE